MDHHIVKLHYTLIVCGLILVFCLQSFLISRNTSPTSDEPPHIAAGLSYWAMRTFRANPEHPPLLKELSALSAMIGGVRWPESQTAVLLKSGNSPDVQPEWQIGASILADQGPDKVLFWARLPMILVAALLGLVIYVWGRQLVGTVPALCALFLFAFDPVLLAHSSLVTTDVGVAAFSMIFFQALWTYVNSPNRTRLLLTGLALGLALGAKFSAVILPFLAVLLLSAATLWPSTRTKNGEQPKLRPNDPCSCGSGRKYRRCHGAASVDKPVTVGWTILHSLLALGFMFLIAAFVVEALYLFSDPFLYVKGFQRINANHNPDYLAFMAGELRPNSYLYLPMAYVLKEPVATVLLTLSGIFTLAFRRTLSPLKKLFLWLPPAVLFAGYMLRADDIGVRYMLPVLPFTWILGGVALSALFASPVLWKRGLAVFLLAWVLVAAVGIYPDQMSYFNETACLLHDYKQVGLDGGSKCGRYWLDDQNVDWGQGTKQLKAWLHQNAPGRPIKWVHYVVFPPAAYSIQAERVSQAELLQDPPEPGLYVVSGHFVARLPAYSDHFHDGTSVWLRRTVPTAVIAHSLFVYDVK